LTAGKMAPKCRPKPGWAGVEEGEKPKNIKVTIARRGFTNFKWDPSGRKDSGER